ncbi:hypothetical protein Golomagni_05872 [Golovinomyces magnicellulatus]|nr:hypothetical protein Golomagni_05872 [Golovinomyces magnicellulatus]
MFRTAILRSAARAAVRPAVRRTTIAAPRIAMPVRIQAIVPVRMYSAGGSLKKDEVEGRIMSLLQGFDKVSCPNLLQHGTIRHPTDMRNEHWKCDSGTKSPCPAHTPPGTSDHAALRRQRRLQRMSRTHLTPRHETSHEAVANPEQIKPAAHFANDLGLDSLDTVEVVMAIEEEFSIEIPDKDADSIHSVDKAVEYILSQPDAN